MRKLSVIALSVLALTGCKVGLDTEVNLSDILAQEHKIVQGNLNVEVTSCSTSGDSRQESKSLIEAKQKIPTIFKNAEFLECYRKDFDSFAHFTIPIDVGSVQDPINQQNTDVYIYSNKKQKIIAELKLTDALIGRINKAKKDLSLMKFNFAVKIHRTKEPINVKALGVFMTSDKGQTTPMVYEDFEWSKSKYATFKLSDVAVNSLLTKGKHPLLLEVDYFEKNK
ncbi:hypothetical protein KKJ17_07335 [Xenorhabdus bovienii]|uniref:DUF7424 family protein n=1 Tax=Xenorhabdus bovienii TaxID=40576 RepID=UPI0023B30CF9|nr:hypothetical protein [Xenorhabdus bovienii]MDE9429047.1 hypothetical protein [Xenorhabdus bovienii]MDE9443458.1 hypothetical protein [Xenorhabdus bovienii]MDE9517562.1 hypothetical protein [Xenorhabdus bovienii]